MSPLSSISASGLQVAQLRMGASAHNVANMNTAHFQRHEVTQETQPTGGVSGSVRVSPEEGVQLEREAVEQMSATYAFKANLQVLRTSETVAGTLLDLHA